MILKRQMRLYDIYRLLVDNEESDINYIYHYSIDKDSLCVLFHGGTLHYYDIDTLEAKESAVRQVNRTIKELRHDNIQRQQAIQ